MHFGLGNEEKTYVAITRQKLSRRRYQHNHFGGKNFSDLQATHKNLTRNQTMALEKYYIEMRDGSNKLNKINSISTKNKYYKAAKERVANYIDK